MESVPLQQRMQRPRSPLSVVIAHAGPASYANTTRPRDQNQRMLLQLREIVEPLTVLNLVAFGIFSFGIGLILIGVFYYALQLQQFSNALDKYVAINDFDHLKNFWDFVLFTVEIGLLWEVIGIFATTVCYVVFFKRLFRCREVKKLDENVRRIMKSTFVLVFGIFVCSLQTALGDVRLRTLLKVNKWLVETTNCFNATVGGFDEYV